MTSQHPVTVPQEGPVCPEPSGLFDPRREYDACGVGFIADLKGGKSHAIIKDALYILENLEHRGAVGADPLAGDGAGILIQIPHEFLSEECAKLKIKLPKPGHYAVGHVFMPRDERLRAHCERVWMRIIREEGLEFLGWRSVPVDNSCLSEMTKAVEPVHRQIFIGCPKEISDEPGFRAAALYHPQGRLQRPPLRLQGPRHRPLHRVAVEPHAGLQGHVPVLPGEGLLPGPVGPARRLGDGARASALLHQHVPVVEAGAPLPHGRPQRRDQHAARQRQLDGGAAGLGVLAAVRQRHRQAVADLLRRASPTRRASTTRSSSW